MSRKKRRCTRPGDCCWACGRWRSNEKSSGRGHARHLCRDCSKLGADELAYRQALRNLERCMTWEGIIPRKRRKSFEQFLDHKDPRIRARAEEMLEEDRAERAYQRSMRELDEALSEEELSDIECNEEMNPTRSSAGDGSGREFGRSSSGPSRVNTQLERPCHKPG